MKNLGYYTDAIFHRLDGEISDRGGYYLIRTPSNPTYYWGNYLLFKSAPINGCFQDWMKIHRKKFGESPDHIAIGWDAYERGEIVEFEANGFKVSKDLVLSLTKTPNAIRINPDLVIAAEHGSVAEQIYRSFGFQEHGLQWRLCKKPGNS